MRVLIVYGDYPPKLEGKADGGADFVQRLAEHLAALGVSVSVLVSRRADRPESLVVNGVEIRAQVRDWSLSGAIRGEFARLRRSLHEGRFDVVHLVYPDPYLRYGGDRYHLPFLLKLAGAKRLLVTFFGFGYTRSGLTSKIGLATLLLQSDFIVLTDHGLLARLRRALPFWSAKTRAGFVGGIQPQSTGQWLEERRECVRASLGLPQDCALIAFFGFWSPDKGLEDLLQAAHDLHERGQAVGLVLIGGREPHLRTTYENSIVRHVQELGIAEHVTMTGPLTTESVVRHLQAVDACALPFRVNPLGRSSLALALTVGVPTIVTTPLVGSEELEGLALVPPSAPHELAIAIARITTDAVERTRVARAARRIAVKYSWSAITAAYLADYERLV